MNKCRSCDADFKGNYFCKPCSKEIRTILKDVKDFSDHKCPGHGPLGGKWYGFVPTSAFLDKYIDYGCVLCIQEAKKEFEWRRIHKKNLEINSESLVKKCCRVIARDPGLLLAATNVDVPEHLWKERGNLAEISSPLFDFFNKKNKSLKSLKSLRVGNICRVMQIILQNFA